MSHCRYASNKDYLTTDDLLIFLESEQGVSLLSIGFINNIDVNWILDVS